MVLLPLDLQRNGNQDLCKSSGSKKMQEYILVQADVTRNTPEHQALLKQYGLFGPPGILLFNPAGEEYTNQRVVGFMPPDRFLLRLNAAAL